MIGWAAGMTFRKEFRKYRQQPVLSRNVYKKVAEPHFWFNHVLMDDRSFNTWADQFLRAPSPFWGMRKSLLSGILTYYGKSHEQAVPPDIPCR
jgi:hypothetical protein